ncbi:hypothetical protein NP493_33g07002 [Ridgeia piscesae]|uniref:lysozyme n=1 Tax=Ridgeia piscesae TaxID=27915 RepID=A0AAD9PCS5_RIDPI|nr:hypothetical protein NP493_33g07002 [Ridgeia piscesae]
MLVAAVVLCLSVVGHTASANLCTAAGGTCVNICSAGNSGACSSGALYAGLCAGSATVRCCIPSQPATPTASTTGPSDNCLLCICKVMGCSPGCVGNVCGPYRISRGYWIDCGRLGGSYDACANNMACSKRCVVAYMKRYVPGPQTCETYARVHKSGPWGKQNWAATIMWNKVKACCAGSQGGC